MCLAIPGKIVEINDNKAKIDYEGIKRYADISLIEGVTVGDWVLVHVGFAIQKVDEKTARETYRLLDEYDEEK